MPRRYDEDDEDDDPPRRPPAKGPALLGTVAILGVVVLVVGGLGTGYFLFAREMSKPKPTPPVVVAPTQPVKPVADTVKPIVHLTRLKKLTATRTLEIDYVVVDEEAVAGATLYLVARSKEGTAQMRFTPRLKGPDTMTVGREADFRGFYGETQVWIEKEMPVGRERVSNIATVYY